MYISSMVIDPTCRGLGLANLLFRDSLAYIRRHFPKVHSAILIVHPDWQAAQRIYRGNSFVEIGTIDSYFALGRGYTHAVKMRSAAEWLA